ncbi:MAG: hypothetical protein P8189_24670 [Anaerolineae bacterium]
MMENVRRKLSLDRPATYQIKVPGELDESWSDWVGGMTISVESEGKGPPVTILTGRLDQAALQGLLRRLYSLGLPLVSVTCLECGQETGSCSCRNRRERERK